MKKFIKILIIVLLINCFNIYSFADTESDSKENTNNNFEISSESAILVEEKTGITVFEKDADKKMYPASTTKIMTAILVLENCELSDMVTVSSNALKSIPSGYVTGELFVEEKLPVEDLLYELLLKSANDVAVVLAEHVSGSVEEFSNLMNKKAKELGCTNTNFVNPNGIHNENHYSTARDLAIIAKYCMQNDKFREIVSTREYNLPKSNKYPFTDRKFKNTNELILPDGKYYYEYATGIKTGYTKEAKSCLISSSSKNDINFISVVLGGSSTSNGKDARFTDTINLFNYGYENYKFIEFKTANEFITNIEIENATEETKNLNLKITEPLTCFSNINFDFDNLEPKIQLNEDISAPISKGDILGKVTYEINGIEYSTNLVATENVEEKNNYLYFIIAGFIILILGILLLFLRKSKNKKIKKNKNRSRKKR